MSTSEKFRDLYNDLRAGRLSRAEFVYAAEQIGVSWTFIEFALASADRFALASADKEAR